MSFEVSDKNGNDVEVERGILRINSETKRA